jgi:hypothetical protein
VGLRRKQFAVGVAVMAVAGGLSAVGTASADTGGMPTVTVTQNYSAQARSTDIKAADGSGYLDGTTWHGYDGSTRADQPKADQYEGAYGLLRAGSGTYRIYDYADGTSVNVTVPSGDSITGVFTSHSLLTVRSDEAGARTLHLLQVPQGGGDVVDRAVQGAPANLSYLEYPAVDGNRAAVVYVSADTTQLAEVDLDTAQFTPFARSAGLNVSGPLALSGDHVVASLTQRGLATFSWDNPGSGPAVDVFPAGSAYMPAGTAVLGDWVAFVSAGPKFAVKATPIGRNEWQTVLDSSSGQNLVPGGPEGTAVVAGGTDSQHWAVQRLSIGTDGTPAAASLAAIPPVSLWQGGGLAFADSRLLVAEDDPSDMYGSNVTGVDITRSADGKLGTAPVDDNYGLNFPAGQSYCEGACRRLTATEELKLFNDADSTVVSAAGRYKVVRDGDSGAQRLESIWYPYVTVKELAQGAATLWGGTLWTAGTAKGTAVPTDIGTLKAGAAVDLGAPCVPSELQAVADRLYWSCGPDGPAGVYDKTAGKSTTVPSGPAQLADGYLVSQDTAAGKLKITYLPGAVPADKVGTSDLAPLPAPTATDAPTDLRGLYWAVDRFGGGAAWFDDSGAVQVAVPQVTHSALAATATRVEDPELRGAQPNWSPNFLFSQPIASWTFQLRDTRTGSVVWNTSGGPVKGALAVTGWNARDPQTGLPVVSGPFAWTLTAAPADGSAQALKLDGQVDAKSMEVRDYGSGLRSDDGVGDFFTVNSAGSLQLQPGNGIGGADSRTTTVTGWSTSSTLIPFGDQLGYRCNDLLVRTSAGELMAWQGSCDSDFTPANRKTSLGTGWNAYNALVSSGDQNGDGRPDLLGRDSAGDLWLFAADGKGGLKPGVKVGWGLAGYTMLVGAGDLNGDGIGDLVARDSAGTLWYWSGKSDTGWNARVQIATGLNSFNALVGVGDYDGDGKADLVGRTTAGNLFRWSGHGDGTLGQGTWIGTGWEGYRNLY